jgi:hypothetical protein
VSALTTSAPLAANSAREQIGEAWSVVHYSMSVREFTFGSGTVGVASEYTHGKCTVAKKKFRDTSALGTGCTCDSDDFL